ncbi:histidine phosphatase family protein [Clostridium sp.]|uniref:histidine phosphatase family protein n=1 Tax=Clostridium sp. TaxID=1506 RepID=UPI0035A00BC1
MDEKVIFYVTRHGETLYNILNNVQGWSDTPLTSKGIKIARLLGKRLKDTPLAAAYSSDSGRAVETAEIILNESGNKQIKLCRDKRLREWGFESLEGTSNKNLLNIILQSIPGINIAQLNHNLPQISQVIVHSDKISWAENFHTIQNRLRSVFKNMSATTSLNGGGNVLVVTHAFTIKTLISIFASHRLSEITKIENASITKIVYQNDNFRIIDINNTHYIR